MFSKPWEPSAGGSLSGEVNGAGLSFRSSAKMRMAHQWGYVSAEGVLKDSIQVLELDLMPMTA